MAALSFELQLMVISALVQGNSISAVVQMTGVAKTTILRWLKRIGPACDRLHDMLVRDLRCAFVEMDEQWSFISKKEARRTAADRADVGDVFTYSAFDRASRLVISYKVGKRTQDVTDAFVEDLRNRLLVAPTVSMDGFPGYPGALAKCFEVVDAGQVIKKYGYGMSPDYKYEPARDAHFIKKQTVLGAPAMKDLSTSLVERYHGTMRHTNGRKRRLCLAFSRRIESHAASVSLSIAAYNFVHVIRTHKKTPAHMAGIVDHPFTMAELLETLLSMPETVERPMAQPLEARPDGGPSRALPAGRGFLRLVTTTAPAKRPKSPAAAPVAPAATLTAVPPPAQGDLFAWASSRPAKPLPPPGTQLDLFPD